MGWMLSVFEYLEKRYKKNGSIIIIIDVSVGLAVPVGMQYGTQPHDCRGASVPVLVEIGLNRCGSDTCCVCRSGHIRESFSSSERVNGHIRFLNF